MNASVTYGIFLWLPRMLQDSAGPGVSVSLLHRDSLRRGAGRAWC